MTGNQARQPHGAGIWPYSADGLGALAEAPRAGRRYKRQGEKRSVVAPSDRGQRSAQSP